MMDVLRKPRKPLFVEDDGYGQTSGKKVIIVGGDDCGKTSLVSALANHQFPNSHISTVFEDYLVNIEVKGNIDSYLVCDVKAIIRHMSYPGTDVILLCFSIDNPNSLVGIEAKWFRELQFNCPTAPIVLVGTKKDLRTDKHTIYKLAKRGLEPVKEEDGHAVANRNGAYAYVECSARLNEGVWEVFETAALALIPKSRKKCTVM